jgi:competence protein ComEC
MDRCLRDLEVTSIALVVLTHFHADHVDGLSGVLEGRTVAEIQVCPLADPPDRAATVYALAAKAGIPVTVAVPGERRVVGRLSWQVLGPLDVPAGATGASPALGASTAVGAASTSNATSLLRAAGSTASEGSAPNNASIVMRVDAGGHVMLLSGDAEPEEESRLVAAGADVQADVFKVAHHGSADQDPAFVAATGAKLAVISVGADNTYGHPTKETLDRLAQLGASVYRTDLDGDIAIVDEGGRLGAVTSK